MLFPNLPSNPCSLFSLQMIDSGGNSDAFCQLLTTKGAVYVFSGFDGCPVGRRHDSRFLLPWPWLLWLLVFLRRLPRLLRLLRLRLLWVLRLLWLLRLRRLLWVLWMQLGLRRLLRLQLWLCRWLGRFLWVLLALGLLGLRRAESELWCDARTDRPWHCCSRNETHDQGSQGQGRANSCARQGPNDR
jgi:hypothetical protein